MAADMASAMAAAGRGRVAHRMDIDDERVVASVALYQRVQSTSQFVALCQKRRKFVIPVVVAFVLWYASYLVLAAYSPGLMAVKVLGNITLAMVVGVLQVLSIFVITVFHGRYMNRTLDPEIGEIRDLVEELRNLSGASELDQIVIRPRERSIS